MQFKKRDRVEAGRFQGRVLHVSPDHKTAVVKLMASKKKRGPLPRRVMVQTKALVLLHRKGERDHVER